MWRLTFGGEDHTSTNMRLKDQVVVVTGASMGIGEAVSRLFAAEGAFVVMASRDPGHLEAARQRVGKPEQVATFACDVSSRQQLDSLLQFTMQRCGHVDVWTNNAGFGLVDSVEKMDMAGCRSMFDTNLFGAIEAMQLVIPVMRRQGSGTIINVSSVAGYIAVPYMAAYGATKHALNCISKAARLELKDSGVHVVNVCPGYVKTNFSVNAVRGADRKRIGGGNVRGVTPERVARAILSGYLRNAREVVVPWRDRVAIWTYRRFPALVEAVMVRMSKSIE